MADDSTLHAHMLLWGSEQHFDAGARVIPGWIATVTDASSVGRIISSYCDSDVILWHGHSHWISAFVCSRSGDGWALKYIQSKREWSRGAS